MTKHLEKIRDKQSELRYPEAMYVMRQEACKTGFTAACEILLPLIEACETVLRFYAKLGNDYAGIRTPPESGIAARYVLSKIKQTIGE